MAVNFLPFISIKIFFYDVIHFYVFLYTYRSYYTQIVWEYIGWISWYWRMFWNNNNKNSNDKDNSKFGCRIALMSNGSLLHLLTAKQLYFTIYFYFYVFLYIEHWKSPESCVLESVNGQWRWPAGIILMAAVMVMNVWHVWWHSWLSQMMTLVP